MERTDCLVLVNEDHFFHSTEYCTFIFQFYIRRSSSGYIEQQSYFSGSDRGYPANGLAMR